MRRLIKLRSVAFLNFFVDTVKATLTGKDPENSILAKTIFNGYTRKDSPSENNFSICFLLQSRSSFLKVKRIPSGIFSGKFSMYGQKRQSGEIVKIFFKDAYFPLQECLFTFFIYSSRAMVIEGAWAVGASISSRKPASRTACAVEGPKQAILVSF